MKEYVTLLLGCPISLNFPVSHFFFLTTAATPFCIFKNADAQLYVSFDERHFINSLVTTYCLTAITTTPKKT